MKKLSKENFLKAEKYIQQHARPLDKLVFEFFFQNIPTDEVIKELKKFQNEDGGFGHGVEPDIRSSLSSPISTTYAIQYLERLNLNSKTDIIDKALKYFEITYKPDTQQWYSISPEITDSPHAPWWSFQEETAKSEENWGNPTVEILGYLIKYGESKKYTKAFEKAIQRLKNKKSIETHELQCYFRLYKSLPKESAELIEKELFTHIKKTVEIDTSKWQGYVTKPLTFVESMDSPLYEEFSELIQLELDMKIYSQEVNGGWNPSWEWGTYPELWKEVKVELTGLITVNNLVLLDKFGRIES